MPDNNTLSYTDETATTPPLKKIKPSLPEISPQENSIQQSCSPLFQELANNTLLQKSIYSLFYSLSHDRKVPFSAYKLTHESVPSLRA